MYVPGQYASSSGGMPEELARSAAAKEKAKKKKDKGSSRGKGAEDL